MNELEKIYDAVLHHVDEIVQRWEQHASQAPWLSLPPGTRIDHLPDLVKAIVHVLQERPDARTAREKAVRIGIKHGRHRRENGLTDEVLHHEHHLLRSAVWDVIRDRHGASDHCFHAITRFDLVLTHTTSASLQGFHIGSGAPPLTEERIVERLTGEGQLWPPPASQI